MAINTIEEALTAMADDIKGARMVKLAHQAVARGGDLQVTLVVRTAKQGAVVSMEARDCVVESFGSFIRLT